MALKLIEADLGRFSGPLRSELPTWLSKQGFPVPCLVVQSGVQLPPDLLWGLETVNENVISAVIPKYHPYLYAVQASATGEITFPFRERIAIGKRRQEFDPVYLLVPVFALLRDPKAPFKPYAIDTSFLPTTSTLNERLPTPCAEYADTHG